MRRSNGGLGIAKGRVSSQPWALSAGSRRDRPVKAGIEAHQRPVWASATSSGYHGKGGSGPISGPRRPCGGPCGGGHAIPPIACCRGAVVPREAWSMDHGWGYMRCRSADGQQGEVVVGG